MSAEKRALAQLNALPGRAEAALAAAALQAAQNTALQARTSAPRRTGALRASVFAASAEGGAKASASVPYAALIELGSLRRPARPFLLPAARQADFSALAQAALQEVIA